MAYSSATGTAVRVWAAAAGAAVCSEACVRAAHHGMHCAFLVLQTHSIPFACNHSAARRERGGSTPTLDHRVARLAAALYGCRRLSWRGRLSHRLRCWCGCLGRGRGHVHAVACVALFVHAAGCAVFLLRSTAWGRAGRGWCGRRVGGVDRMHGGCRCIYVSMRAPGGERAGCVGWVCGVGLPGTVLLTGRSMQSPKSVHMGSYPHSVSLPQGPIFCMRRGCTVVIMWPVVSSLIVAGRVQSYAGAAAMP